MAIITQAEAITRCQAIRDATAANSNTALLVGQLLADIAESLTTWGSGSGPTGPTGPTGPAGPTGPSGPVAGTNGELVYNAGGSPGGTTFTTDGLSLLGLQKLNGKRVANGVLGTEITEPVTISIAGGSDYEIPPSTLSSNITVVVSAAGSPTEGQALTVWRFDTSSYDVILNDDGGNLIYRMPGGAEAVEVYFSEADGKYVAPIHKPLG